MNRKAAATMLNAGMSQVQVKRFTACMEIPPVNISTLKRNERKIGPVIEEVAKLSCNAAIEVEKSLISVNAEGVSEIGAPSPYYHTAK